MNANIIGISQDFNFDTGEKTTYMMVLLPDGVGLRVPLDSDQAQHVAQLQVELSGAEMPRPGTPRPGGLRRPASVAPQPTAVAPDPMPMVRTSLAQDFAPARMDDEGTVVFGGDDGDDGDAADTYEASPPEDAVTTARLQHIQSALNTAAAAVAGAAPPTEGASAAEVHARADALRQQLNVPRTAHQPLRVRKNAAGYPEVVGPGMADPSAFVGGDTDGEEDVGSI